MDAHVGKEAAKKPANTACSSCACGELFIPNRSDIGSASSPEEARKTKESADWHSFTT